MLRKLSLGKISLRPYFLNMYYYSTISVHARIFISGNLKLWRGVVVILIQGWYGVVCTWEVSKKEAKTIEIHSNTGC
jgi:hypothetical protein